MGTNNSEIVLESILSKKAVAAYTAPDFVTAPPAANALV